MSAAQSSLRNRHEPMKANLIKAASTSSPRTLTRVSNVIKKSEPEINECEMTPDAALALLLNLDLSVENYNHLKTTYLQYGHSLYPNYHKILAAKKQTYSELEIVSENEVRVILNNLNK